MVEVAWIVGQPPALEVDRRRRWIVDLDPVAAVPIAIPESIAIGCEEFADDWTEVQDNSRFQRFQRQSAARTTEPSHEVTRRRKADANFLNPVLRQGWIISSVEFSQSSISMLFSRINVECSSSSRSRSRWRIKPRIQVARPYRSAACRRVRGLAAEFRLHFDSGLRKKAHITSDFNFSNRYHPMPSFN